MKLIADFLDGDRIDGQFLVASMNRCSSNAGRPYLNLILQDSSGTIPAKKWDVEQDDERILAGGNVVSISGDVLDYKGALQFKILSVRELDQSLIDVYRFALPCPVDPKLLEKHLDELLSSFEEGDLKKLVTGIIADHRKAYVSYPAAVKNHHNCLGGLMYHSLRMADLAEEICRLYDDLDRDLLVAGCILHDLDGKPEFGAAVRPEIREAFALSMIDDFDAKMDIISKALEGLKTGEWSQRIMAMDESYFYKHK